MSVPKCTSWRGHRFEARYSTGTAPKPPAFEDLGVASISEASFLEWAELHTKQPRTYERDVCIRCGATIERAPPNQKEAKE